MKSLTFDIRDYDMIGADEITYATNDNGTGLFMRLPHQAAYQQLTGTMQFYAKNRRSFLKQLQQLKPVLTAARIVRESGWDD